MACCGLSCHHRILVFRLLFRKSVDFSEFAVAVERLGLYWSWRQEANRKEADTIRENILNGTIGALPDYLEMGGRLASVWDSPSKTLTTYNASNAFGGSHETNCY